MGGRNQQSFTRTQCYSHHFELNVGTSQGDNKDFIKDHFTFKSVSDMASSESILEIQAIWQCRWWHVLCFTLVNATELQGWDKKTTKWERSSWNPFKVKNYSSYKNNIKYYIFFNIIYYFIFFLDNILLYFISFFIFILYLEEHLDFFCPFNESAWDQKTQTVSKCQVFINILNLI